MATKRARTKGGFRTDDRVVTATEFARNSASVLRLVRQTERDVLISRHGRLVAVVSPLNSPNAFAALRGGEKPITSRQLGRSGPKILWDQLRFGHPQVLSHYGAPSAVVWPVDVWPGFAEAFGDPGEGGDTIGSELKTGTSKERPRPADWQALPS